MGRWLIAMGLGLCVLAAVYFFRQNIVSAPPSGAPASSNGMSSNGMEGAHDGMTMPGAAGPAAHEDGPGGEDDVAVGSDGTSPKTIPDGTAGTLISVDFPWARPTIEGKDITAVYMLLTNNGQADAFLKGARSPDAARIELHETVVSGSVVSMKAVPQLDLEPGVPTALEQGGLHLMVMGLKHPLKDGDTLKVTLDFGAGGTVDVDVPVGEPDNGATP